MAETCMSTQELRLTARDMEILHCLTERCRVFSIPQLERTWWQGQTNGALNARARMEKLEAKGYVELREKLVREELMLSGPEITFSPGDPLPEFGTFSWQCRKRWENREIIPTELVWATEKTKKELNGSVGGRPPRSSEVSHDLMLSKVFLWYREHEPEIASNWVHEDKLRTELGHDAARGEFPDALIRTSEDTPPILAIELAGAYRKEKLLAWHAANCHTPYAIW